MTTFTAEAHREESQALRWGVYLMTFGALAFIGYAIIFFARNFTDSFLELGIGPDEVSVGKTEIEAFGPSLYHYIGHLHIAVSGFIAATGLAVAALAWFGVRRRYVWAWVGRRGTRARPGGRAAGALPLRLRHDRPPRPDLPRDGDLRRRRRALRKALLDEQGARA